MKAIQRAGHVALGLVAILAAGACNDTSDPPGDLAGGEGATETNAIRPVCDDDSECPEGVECIFPDPDAGVGQCDIEVEDPGDGSGAGGTCLAGDPACDDLGPADEPTDPAGGTCLAGDPACEDLGAADEPLGAAGGTCLAGDPACEDLGAADEPLGAAGGTCLAGDPACEGLGAAGLPPAGGTCLAGDPSCGDLGPADEAPGLCEEDEDCLSGRCTREPGDPAGVCEPVD